jgi:hypothetical protein
MPYKLPPVNEEVRRQLSSSIIGFLSIRRNGEIVDPSSVGSGTLVKLGDGAHGILTAAHVLDALPENTPVGILLFTRPGSPQQFKIEIDPREKIYASGWAKGCKVPDLAFLRLHQPRISDLEAYGCVFYDLEKVRTLRENENVGVAWQLYVVGVVAESENRLMLAHGEGRHVITNYKAIYGACDVRRNFRVEGFELVAAAINFTAAWRPPNSYGGVSGGGLWVLTSPTGDGENLRRMLLGVAIRETSSKRSARLIICHTFEGVHGVLLPQVRATNP